MESLRQRIIKGILDLKSVKREAIEKIDKESGNFREFKDNLIKNGIATKEDILLILSEEYRIPYLDLNRYTLSRENKDFLSKELAFHYKVLPISKIGGVLTLATSNPLDPLIDDLKLATSLKIGIVLAGEDKITEALHNLYSEDRIDSLLKGETSECLSEVISLEPNLDNLVKESTLAPIVRVVDLIIYEALKRRSSDIHIEPTDEGLSVRYRIDGILHHSLTFPKRNQNAILARLKIMSSLNITEFRIPQDGRFKIKFQDREIDFRVSSLPTNFGEKVVLRILDRESLSLGLKELGFSDKPLELFEQALHAPFGIILVTGPTGSGKSTTLYSIINQMDATQKNIITIEDPVEYQIEGITQVQVNPGIGLDFVSCLRTALRQSPDVIMVGEIRDRETADIAIKASLTGELIFSTLHTNNSVGAITRLVDMGIEPFLLSSSLVVSTAQRLARKLCSKCKVEEKTDETFAERIGFKFPPFQRLYKPGECNYCDHTGYRGRTALLEILSLDDIIREMITRRASETEIAEYAREKRDFLFLKEDGFKKCIEGLTSWEEVLRVAG